MTLNGNRTVWADNHLLTSTQTARSGSAGDEIAGPCGLGVAVAHLTLAPFVLHPFRMKQMESRVKVVSGHLPLLQTDPLPQT